ncbi:TyrR/PhhR family helix-turn-helix DNA-binding protein [Marinomonas algarum]|uniref:Sigma 54-interacting transcriptional regulator n=1 Tax=Marinomonas algarum TaxID=2883105 RepID=A0A9X1LDN3_9GAMM|nr:TyrR/PhhR family helix-turn-helix DNA-binding protein [Marinomonas algarum]MCB5162747.1 sigma 54-interacting transcriptional regulator [Marinomonas algarum]
MRLEIQCEDRIGMVREALDLFVPLGIDMRLVEVDTLRRCIYCGFPDIAFETLQCLLANIRRLDSVEDVKTVMFTPSEREHNALYTLLEALPDGVISVDLKGHITMVTALAAEELNVSVEALLHQPLSHFIKGVPFTKDTWANPKEGVSKRIRVKGKALLLEMKPIFVSDDEGHKNTAGTVLYLKSEARLDRQTASLKRAPEAEQRLEAYFHSAVIKSHGMRETLRKAKAFMTVDLPLLVQGDVGVGKGVLIEALFQYWQQRQGEQDARLIVCHARDITREEVSQWHQQPGWRVIKDIEQLDETVQEDLIRYLAQQSNIGTSLDTPVRLISVSSLDEVSLSQHPTLKTALYLALSSLTLSVPALRDRAEDLPGLVQQILQAESERHRLPMPLLSKGAMTKLALYEWPGNIVQLHNVCRQTLLTAPSTPWQPEEIHLPTTVENGLGELVEHSLERTMKRWESDLLKALYPHYPSTRKLAKAVGMSHSAIANKLKDYGIKT